MKLTKFALSLILGLFALNLCATNAFANEGLVDLVGNNVECLATSVEVTPKKYDILLRCSNVVYPPGSGNLYYLWAEGDNNKVTRLGDIGLGKAKFTANTPFNNLFVTIEQKRNPVSNSGIVVMRGNVTSFSFNNISNDEPTTIKPLEEEELVTSEAEVEKIDEETEKASESNILTRITSFLLRAGIIILIVVAVVGVVMFVISKIR